jgi:GT2 family glycosyltransferase
MLAPYINVLTIASICAREHKVAAGSLPLLMATTASDGAAKPSKPGSTSTDDESRPTRRESLPVVVAVVATAGGPRLRECLEALTVQDYPSLTVLVIDHGDVSGRETRKAIVAAAAPAALVRAIDDVEDPLIGANDVLTSVEGAPFLCFVADDVELEPTALRLLVEEAFRSNAAICGPKIVDQDDPDVLLEVGLTIDHYGVTFTGIEPGERDQEQHDAVRDAFFVSTAVMLVRADLFRELGGFDVDCLPGHSDLDLCWRARSAGARVMVVPDARARRDATAARRADVIADLARDATRTRVRTLLKNYSPGALVWVLPLAAALNAIEAIGYLTQRRFGLARSVFVGWWSGIAQFRGLREARRAVQARRTIDDRDVRSYMVRGSARARVLLARRRHRGLVLDVAEGRLRSKFGALAAALRSVDVWLAIVVVGLVAFGLRNFVFDGVAPAAGFQRWTSTGDLLGAWATRWRYVGLGADAPGSAMAGLAGVASAFALGNAALAQTVVVAGSVPLGLVGAYRLTRRLSPRALPAAATLLVYAANPIVRNAYAGARLDVLVSFAIAPFVLARVIVLIDGAQGSARRRAVAGVVVLCGIGAAFAPVFALFPLVVAASVLLALPIVGGGRDLARAVVLAVVTLVGAIVVLSPWSFDAIGHSGGLGLTRQATPSFASLLTFRTGPAGAGVWPWAIGLAALLPLVVATERRFVWALRMWMMALVSLALAVGFGRSDSLAIPPVELVLLPAALGLAVAVGIGLSAFFNEIHSFVFGVRQGVAVALAVASAVPIFGLVPDVFDGRFDAPETSWESTLAFLSRETRDRGAFRIAWVGDPTALPVPAQAVDGRIGYAITRNGVGDARDLFPPAAGRPESVLVEAMSTAFDDRTARLGHSLAPLGVRYIVLVDRVAPDAADRAPLDERIGGQLDIQLDLRLSRRVEGLVVYENDAWVSPRAFVEDETFGGTTDYLSPAAAVEAATRSDLTERTTALRGPASNLSVPSAGTIHLAERFDPAWQVAGDGTESDQAVSFGWANRFDLTSPATVSMRVERDMLDSVQRVAVVAVWLALLLIALWRPRGAPRLRALVMDAPAERAARRSTRRGARRNAGIEPEVEDASSDDEEFAALAALAATPVAQGDDVDWSVLEMGAEDDE